MSVKICCVITRVAGSKTGEESGKKEGIVGGAETDCVVPGEGVKASDIRRRLSAVCGDAERACGTVFKWVGGC